MHQGPQKVPRTAYVRRKDGFNSNTTEAQRNTNKNGENPPPPSPTAAAAPSAHPCAHSWRQQIACF